MSNFFLKFGDTKFEARDLGSHYEYVPIGVDGTSFSEQDMLNLYGPDFILLGLSNLNKESTEVTEVFDKALRYNEGKPQWSLVDFESLLPLVKVLEFGAKKYSRDNWKKGLEKEKLIDSLLRHSLALASGEEIDKESGLPHIGHILANCMFYSHFYCKEEKKD